MGRGHRSEDDEDVEMGSDREGDAGGDREDRRSHKRSKKSKKSKKSKSRRRSRSRSPLNDDRSSRPLEDGEFNDEDTDKEGTKVKNNRCKICQAHGSQVTLHDDFFLSTSCGR